MPMNKVVHAAQRAVFSAAIDSAIKANIDYLLGYSEPGRKKEQER